MRIKRTKSFLKSYQKLPRKIQEKADEKVAMFLDERTNPKLKDHALIGRLRGKRTFSVTGDYRIIYREEKDGSIVFVFLDIGTHSQAY